MCAFSLVTSPRRATADFDPVEHQRRKRLEVRVRRWDRLIARSRGARGMPARSRTCGGLESRTSEPGRGLEETPIPSPDTPSFDCPRVRTALSPPLRVACCARDTNFHRRRLEALLTLSLLSHLLRSPNGRFGLGIEEVEAFGVYNYPNRIAGVGARAWIEATENRHVVVLGSVIKCFKSASRWSLRPGLLGMPFDPLCE